MKTLRTIILILTLASEASLAGDAEIILSPNNPSTTSAIEVLVVARSNNGCEIFGPEIINLEVAGSEVLLTVNYIADAQVTPCPPFSESLSYSIGLLPQGVYNLTIFGNDIQNPSANPNFINGPINFEVRGNDTPQAVPTLSIPAIAILVILFLSALRLKNFNSIRNK